MTTAPAPVALVERLEAAEAAAEEFERLWSQRVKEADDQHDLIQSQAARIAELEADIRAMRSEVNSLHNAPRMTFGERKARCRAIVEASQARSLLSEGEGA